MAAIYLGLTESGAVLLPPIRWMGGGSPSLPIEYTRQVDKATMLSGATRFNFRTHHPRRWVLGWEMLTAAELAVIIGLSEETQELVFQNNWEDATWREVVVAAPLEYAPFLKTGTTGCRYAATLTLDEVVE